MTAFNKSAIPRCMRIHAEVLVFTLQVGIMSLCIHVEVEFNKCRSETGDY